MIDPDSSDFVGSFARGLAIIESFSVSSPRQTLSEAAEASGLSRASARRFLLTLVSLGYARFDGKYFELTPAILKLGFAFLSSLGIWPLAQATLAAVTRDLNESCSVTVLDGEEIVYVARSAARHRILSIGLHVGTRFPAHATSMGHVLLAGLSESELGRYYETAHLERFTDRTLCTRSALAARIAQVRKDGFALCDGELEAGLRTIAVPIRNAQGHVFAAMNVSTNMSRVSIEEMKVRFLLRLQQAANEIQEMTLHGIG